MVDLRKHLRRPRWRQAGFRYVSVGRPAGEGKLMGKNPGHTGRGQVLSAGGVAAFAGAAATK